jgi:hypothetical protein
MREKKEERPSGSIERRWAAVFMQLKLLRQPATPAEA